MKIIRTWPETVPAGRAHVVDDLPRYVMSTYDYRKFFKDVDDDVLIVEWDIAFSLEDLEFTRDLIAVDPHSVHAAPYRVYLVPRDPGPHWVMRRLDPDEPDDISKARWVTERDLNCHLFGFGMTYVPRELSRAFLATKPPRTTDTTFSKWHHYNVRDEVPIPWHVRPVHLHYEIENVPQKESK